MNRRDFLRGSVVAAGGTVVAGAGLVVLNGAEAKAEPPLQPVNLRENIEGDIRTSDLQVVSYEKVSTVEDGIIREKIDLCVYLQTNPDLLGIRVGKSYKVIVDHHVADIIIERDGESKEPLRFAYQFTGMCTENSMSAAVNESAIVTLCFEGIR